MSSVGKLRAGMSLLGQAQITFKTIRPPGVAWWPTMLEGKLDQNTLEPAGMKLYSSGRLLFAFQAGSERAFMYRESGR